MAGSKPKRKKKYKSDWNQAELNNRNEANQLHGQLQQAQLTSRLQTNLRQQPKGPAFRNRRVS